MNLTKINALIEKQAYPSISIMLQTNRKSPDIKMYRIALKNAVKNVASRLDKQKKVTRQEMKEILKHLTDQVNSVRKRKLLDGMAIFVNKHIQHTYYLPHQVINKVVVGDRFALRDLIYVSQNSPKYNVLVVSESCARFFQHLDNKLSELLSNGFPLKHVAQESPSQRMTSSAPAGSGWLAPSGKSAIAAAPLPGTYVPDLESYRQERFKRFCRQILQLVSDQAGAEETPTVIAGTSSNIDVFRDICGDHLDIIGSISGSYDSATTAIIEQQAQPLVSDCLRGRVNLDIERVKSSAGSETLASGVIDCWHKVKEGRVDRLFVERNYSCCAVRSGRTIFVPDSPERNLHSWVDDIVEEIIQLALDSGAHVVFVPDHRLKEQNHIAALLRY